MMKLLGLKVQDLRNVAIVDVEFKDKKFVEITGNNGAAKSTLLDSLWLAIIGGKYFGRGYPAWRAIQDGKDKAIVKAVIGNDERQISIKRSFVKREIEGGETETGGSLVIEDTAGAKLGQEFLETLFSAITVDPVHFARMAPKDQINVVKKLAKIDGKDEALRVYVEALKEERKFVNRNIKSLEAVLAENQAEEVEPVEISDLLSKKSKILSDKNAIEQRKAQLEQANTSIAKDKTRLEESIKADKERLAKLAKEIEDNESRVREAEKTLLENKDELSKVELESGKIESVEPVDAAIKNAAAINLKADAWKRRKENLAKYEQEKKLQDSLNVKIGAKEDERRSLFANSSFPFKNISFDDDAGLLIDNIPFSQHSQGERIKISARIGMELGPELRVICIRDGSELDDKAMEVLSELADKHGYQVLVERVGEVAGENRIVLRGGAVISQYEKETTASEKASEMDSVL
jgi:DNA repair exonuclease SbcCD ATPase subunit